MSHPYEKFRKLYLKIDYGGALYIDGSSINLSRV